MAFNINATNKNQILVKFDMHNVFPFLYSPYKNELSLKKKQSHIDVLHNSATDFQNILIEVSILHFGWLNCLETSLAT